MSEIILYPTETVYGLGVNAFDAAAWSLLCTLKGRAEKQTASWLVRSEDDIERLGVVTSTARQIMEKHMPGPVTLVLQARGTVPKRCQAVDRTVSFRMSSDPLATKLIFEYMKHSNGVPLTCTSANVHGLPTLTNPVAIMNQFGDRRSLITRVIDGGARSSEPSTVVRCVGKRVEVLRQGAVTL